MVDVKELTLKPISQSTNESNNVIERFHSIIIAHLRILQETQLENNDLINYAILIYNSSKHSATGFTIFGLVSGQSTSKSTDEKSSNRNYKILKRKLSQKTIQKVTKNELKQSTKITLKQPK